jgi:hypothetical protein
MLTNGLLGGRSGQLFLFGPLQVVALFIGDPTAAIAT